MINRILIILFSFLVLSCLRNDNVNNIVFDEYSHNFGFIPFKSRCEFNFKFTNKGAESILIEYVAVYCDCLEANKPEKEIKPGEINFICVRKNTSVLGPFKDTILVYYYKCKNPDTLRISGTIKYQTKQDL